MGSGSVDCSILGVSQTCLGANVLSGLVPSTFLKNYFGIFLGSCVWGRGRSRMVPLHNLRVTSHVLHQDVPLGW